ncbi:unnamed protein product [Sphagnum compactum]
MAKFLVSPSSAQGLLCASASSPWFSNDLTASSQQQQPPPTNCILSWKHCCSSIDDDSSSSAVWLSKRIVGGVSTSSRRRRAAPLSLNLVLPQASSQAVGLTAEAESLNDKFGKEGVKVESGEGGLPKVSLSSPNGSVAEVYLYGACTTSWKTAEGKDLLFVRPDAVFTGQKPISGGIPHCFPQFGPGSIQQHGFARNVSWDISSTESDADSTTVVLELKPSTYSRNMWDYEFVVNFKIVLGNDKLSTEMTVQNTDQKPFSFTTALHTYFRAAIANVSVKGLKGCETFNKPYEDPKNPVKGTEDRETITFPGFVDCMYRNTPNEVVLANGLGTTLSIKNSGWSDVVLWNPYLTMEACYKDFVCVENAQLEPVQLQPGDSWTAQQSLVPI